MRRIRVSLLLLWSLPQLSLDIAFAQDAGSPLKHSAQTQAPTNKASPVNAAAVVQPHLAALSPSDQVSVQVDVDGDVTPDLVPELLAYQHFFRALATDPNHDQGSEQRRRLAYVRYYFQRGCGAEGTVDRSLNEDQTLRLLDVADQVAQRLAAFETDRSAGKDDRATVVLRDEIVRQGVGSLEATMGTDAAAKVRDHVLNHVRRRIKLLSVSMPMPSHTATIQPRVDLVQVARTEMIIPSTAYRHGYRYAPALFAPAVALSRTPALSMQYMSDYSSTYIDGWADDFYIYGSGSTNGALSFHTYAVDVEIDSPLGRSTYAAQSNYVHGYATNSTMLDWNLDDCCDYKIKTVHKLYCTVSLIYAVLVFEQIVRNPPKKPCVDPGTATCGETNHLPTTGPYKDSRCKRVTYCCTAVGEQPINGWCRTETCEKCSAPTEPFASLCYQDELTCKDKTKAYMCLGVPCRP